MKRKLLRVLAFVTGAALLLFFAVAAFGVWVPDLYSDAHHTLATAALPSGYGFHVVQYWNHFDFYSTELHVQTPDGHTEVHTLDGDDAKSWHVPLRVDEPGRTATVVLGGNRERTVHW